MKEDANRRLADYGWCQRQLECS